MVFELVEFAFLTPCEQGLSGIFWWQNGRGQRMTTKLKGEFWKKITQECWQVLMRKKPFEKYLTGVLSKYIFKLYIEGVLLHSVQKLRK